MNQEEETPSSSTFNNTANRTPSPPHSPEYAAALNRDRLQLQELNDRFASYIDTVRQWGDPEYFSLNLSNADGLNGPLVAEHLATVKKTYEKELNSYRCLYDEAMKEKAHLGVLIKENETEMTRLTHEVYKVKEFNGELCSNIESLEKALEKRDLDYLKYSRELEALKKKEDSRVTELIELKATLEDQKKTVNEERTLRIKFMNMSSSLEEKMAFENNVYREEISSAFNRISELQNMLVTKASAATTHDYLTYDELAQLRLELQSELTYAKENVVADFKQKMSEVQNELADTIHRMSELTMSRDKTQQLLSQVQAELSAERSKSSSLELRLKTLESDHVTQLALLQQSNTARETRLNEVTDQLHSLMYDYEELVGVRVALDTELNAYRKLLESEERRLKVNLTPRKRTYLETTNNESVATVNQLIGGRVKFESCDLANASYIKLLNCSKKQMTLSGYKIQRRLSGSDNIEVFKLPPKVVIPLNTSITIYVPSHDGEPDPCILVLTEPQIWFQKGEDTVLSLLDAKDQVAAEISVTYSKPMSLESTPLSKSRPPLRGTGLFNRSRAGSGSPSPAFSRLRAAISPPHGHRQPGGSHERRNCTIS